MKNDGIIFVISLIMIVSLLIIILWVNFVMNFNQKKYNIVKKMRTASNYQEYLSWRYKLRCLYLRLIPFVNDDNESKLYDRIYNSNKHKEEKRSDGLNHLLAPSLMAIMACALYLCGTSWAWYSSSQVSSVSSIVSATYDADVAINVDGATSGMVKTNTISQMDLESGKEYLVTIKASGNATSGYCKVEVGNEVYYTNSIIPNDEYSFKIKVNENCVLKITPQWGTCAIEGHDVNANDLITYGIQASESIENDTEVNEKPVVITKEEKLINQTAVIIENDIEVKEEVEEEIIDSTINNDAVVDSDSQVDEETSDDVIENE